MSGRELFDKGKSQHHDIWRLQLSKKFVCVLDLSWAFGCRLCNGMDFLTLNCTICMPLKRCNSPDCTLVLHGVLTIKSTSTKSNRFKRWPIKRAQKKLVRLCRSANGIQLHIAENIQDLNNMHTTISTSRVHNVKIHAHETQGIFYSYM